MRTRFFLLILIAMPAVCRAADDAVLKSIPVREVTVFKDGHAFVTHEGTMPVGAEGNVVLDYLPRPVVGTFWSYSAEPQAKLEAVTAGKKRVSIERTALSMRELIEANIDKEVVVTEAGTEMEMAKPYGATIIGVPAISSKELRETSPPGTPESLEQKGEMVLLRTAEGIRSIPIALIRDITFKKDPAAKVAREEMRNQMTMRLAWTGAPAAEARVGVAYIQQGMRWIPSYRIRLDGNGKARVELEASLINDLADMNDVTVHLVVGVPTFKFAGTLDPVSLQETVARVSSRIPQQANLFSNAFMTQISNSAVSVQPMEPQPATPPGESDGRNEDLFLYTLEHVTLRQGERLVTPIASFELDYQDVYTVDIPFAPSFEMFGRNDNINGRELARMQQQPKAMHKIRIANTGKCPLTTAPALVLNGECVLAQSLMTYTPIGSKVDLTITQAIDIPVTQADTETSRKFNALTINTAQYMRIDSDSKLQITNRRAEPAHIEVTRYVFGAIDEVDHNGQKLASSLFDYESFLNDGGLANWLGQMPWWVWDAHINAVMRAKWTLDLAPGANQTVNYKWHYFWR